MTFRDAICLLEQDFRKYLEIGISSGKNPFLVRIKTLFFSLGFLYMVSYRIRFWGRNKFGCTRNWFFRKLMNRLNHYTTAFFIVTLKTQINHWPEVGPGLFLSPKGGIIIGARRIGANCTIHDRVTIGLGIDRVPPEIGDNVWIGPDTVIYGKIVLGSGSTVLGSTVIGKSIPENSLVSGNPGIIVQRNFDNSRILGSFDTDVDMGLHESSARSETV